MQATPATWRVLLQSGWKGRKGFRALCGGEALAPDLATELLACCDEVWNLYGPTETTVWSTCWRVQHPETGVSIGTPIANTRVWILDAQHQLCPIGVPGEICIGGAGVARGYHGRPELTADRFIANPFADGGFASDAAALLYRTGDRGRWLPDGTLEHLGRLDFQVKIRGFRIELGEIEAIARKDAAVADCVAVAYDVAAHDRRLVLYAASNESEATLLPRLRAQLVASLPGYMQPQHLIVLQSLPQTPNGKIDRQSLPAPVLMSSADAEQSSAPRIADPRQRYLAMVWCELIGIDDVQPRDNFLDVGGHSLLAVEMAARVRRETGVRLNLLEIATGTLASLAMELPESADATPSPRPSMGAKWRRLLGLR
jgi:acyl-CoA synthetase (AMP-forming)/AMP-acid ligase II